MKYFLSLVLFIFFYNPPQKKDIDLLAANYKAALFVIFPLDHEQSNKYILTTNRDLYNYYLHNCSNSKVDYNSFLNKLYKRKILVDTLLANCHSCSIIKSNNLPIIKEYDQKGIRYIKRKYLLFLGDEFRNKSLDHETMMGLIKIMIDNDYVVWFSNYSGFYSFKSIKAYDINGKLIHP
jgi:hypothetical protein